MKTEELIKLMVASGAVKVQGGKVTVEPSKMAGRWTNDGRHGWRRGDPDGDGGGQGGRQDSGD